jgi:hypothetical protein
MTDPTRLEILNRLQRLSELAPDLRFGQLIASLTFMAAGPWDQTLWDLDDDRLAAAMRQFEEDLSRRSLDGPNPTLPLADEASKYAASIGHEIA